MTVLMAVHKGCRNEWIERVAPTNALLKSAGEIFDQVDAKVIPYKTARDKIRDILGNIDSKLGCYGTQFTNGYSVVRHLLRSNVKRLHKQYVCKQCQHVSL